MGLYGHHDSIAQSQTLVPCSDMCGTILTPNNTVWKEGERVISLSNQTHLNGQIKESDMVSELGLPLPGVLTQYRTFPAIGLIAAPEYLSDEEASCLPTAAVTAWMAVNGFRPLGQPARDTGETVLLQGTGGVSIAGLQIAHAAGLKTIITSSSDAKLVRAKRDLGADVGVNYKSTPGWEKAVLDATQGRGADIIFENGGALTLRKSFDCVAFGGLINCIGYLSGKEDEPGDRMNTNVLALRRNVTLKGLLNGPKDRFEEMLKFYEEKKVRPVVDKVFGFEEAREGLEYLFSGGHFGKVVVRVS
jgi:NADPH:quinone reductase-like Zn-dependent oxidoreductase